MKKAYRFPPEVFAVGGFALRGLSFALRGLN